MEHNETQNTIPEFETNDGITTEENNNNDDTEQNISIESFINFEETIESLSSNKKHISDENISKNDSIVNTLETIISSISNANNASLVIESAEPASANDPPIEVEIHLDESLATLTNQENEPNNKLDSKNDETELALPNEKSKEINVDKFLRLNELIDSSFRSEKSKEKSYSVKEGDKQAADSDVICESEEETQAPSKDLLGRMSKEAARNSKIRFREVKVTRLVHQTTTFVFREVIDIIDNTELECSLDSTRKEKEVIEERTDCRFLTQKEIVENCLNTKTNANSSQKKSVSKASHAACLDKFKKKESSLGKKSYSYVDRINTTTDSSDDERLFVAKPTPGNHQTALVQNSSPRRSKNRRENSLKKSSSSSSLSSVDYSRSKRRKTRKPKTPITLTDSESESMFALKNKSKKDIKKRKLKRKTRSSELIDFKKYKIDLITQVANKKDNINSTNKRLLRNNSVYSNDLNGVPFLKECSVKLKRIDIRKHLPENKNSKLPQLRNTPIRLRKSLRRAYN